MGVKAGPSADGEWPMPLGTAGLQVGYCLYAHGRWTRVWWASAPCTFPIDCLRRSAGQTASG